MEPLVQSLSAPDGDGDELQGVAGIYIVGGASALPLVPRLLRARFGRRVHRAPLPSASTAVGLAIAADRTAGFTLRDRLSRGFGVFREREGGAAVSFDPVLDRSLLTAEVVGAPSDAEPVVVTRRYQAAHNIGWFRFVEYSGVDDQGEPRGDLAPVAEIVFPFDPDLQARSAAGTDPASAAEALRGTPIVRQAGPVVEERYTVDPAGIVSVTITDTGTGYRQEHVLQA
jgi:molecular chaperone DnaK (HSP70)